VSEPTSEFPEAPALVPWYHWLWVAPLAGFFRLWLTTLRFRSAYPAVDDSAGPSVLVLWHDKLFVTPWIAARCFRRPVTALISTSKDGAWLVAFYRMMGISAVRGSSNRRGAAALVSLARAVRGGHHAGITPDGPKGPAYEFKTGAVALARLTDRPFVVLGIRYHACRRLRSWDRFALPLPFSRVDLALIPEPGPGEGESDESVAARLQAKLLEHSA
jgi:lysophospholipid acyltransferase (LPLAT)-like uncharacterized protein